MRNKIVGAIILALSLSSSSQAESQKREKMDWPVAGAEFLPIVYGQLVLHELSHGIFAMTQGAGVEYKLYPHLNDGQLVFADAEETHEWYDHSQHGKWMYATAAVLDIFEVVAIAAVDRLFHLPRWVRTTLKVLQAAAATDFVYNSIGLWTGHEGNDFSITAHNMGMEIWPARLLATTIGAGLAGTTLFF